MTAQLPPNLLALFQPRPPLRWLNPSDYAPEDRTTAKIDGVAQYVQALQEKKEEAKNDPHTMSQMEKADNAKLEKIEKQKWLMSEGYKQLYKPNEDDNVRGDAFKTLFVGRLDYKTTTKDLEDAFGRYGEIDRVRVVTDRGEKKKGAPRGYAFILFIQESACKAAYKDGEYTVIRGRRCLVDVERGRTVSGWRPRRFGGGLGGRHYTKAVSKPSFGHGPPSGPGFGRPGFRGGFGNDRGFRGGGRQGSGGFRGGGGSYGGRGGMGYGGPDSAPSGPRGPRGYGNNANLEPLPPRGGGYRDRDSYGSGQKRPHDGGGHDDPRQRRRY